MKTVSELTRQREAADSLTMKTHINVPLREAVFDVVERGVDKDTGVVPSTRLDADSLMDERVLREALVRDGDGYHTGQSHVIQKTS